VSKQKQLPELGCKLKIAYLGFQKTGPNLADELIF